MYGKIQQYLQEELQTIEDNGIFKKERIITSPQGAEITISTGEKVLNFCANNYLGLSSHPEVVQAAKDALDTHGFGMSSVRFICGTQDIHKTLEKKIADFYGTEDTILYAAAFDANGGVFEPLFGENDAIISDSLNHASIIDGVRLCKAARYRYENSNMEDLEQQLIKANEAGHRFKIIVTDGVFSMDGLVAPLDKICDLADKYDALVMVDECHAAGFIGATGKGTLEAKGVMGRVDIVTGTLGKALGGAMGGYTTAKKEIIELLRQRSRPYLFSNSLAPSIVGASIKVFELLEKDTTLRDKLEWNTNYFKKGMKEAGFDIIDGDSAIVPVMLYDAKLSQNMANELLKEGIYVIGFFFPVVPRDKARIRVQLSAAHTKEHLDAAIQAFTTVGKRLNVI
ncbi:MULTISPECIES: glycine C-acetyltransferase [Flavobacterium]|jgi:glycine C-acetyltransferase|uniref:2-amino-3-ketobutyrate coenzyme A ligase n=1 Tax=Flavobacterium lindanitolerans TaxID=428988 RepID=A0A497UZQ8_9FLAO|nr:MULTISPECIES: glycine C-acetyltransferase [Flavobacterium]PZO28591.1 MAG: glycine C-acetyltransferase [Flavobacteriaceae bacterium]PZQ92827.1 MAG: glycine C-acetyltransferase [Flavobacterium johnsoniae]KQS49971.1 2-amino-3-ketobutyrate CoA ligase [Flavobacterium sp. Leaf359]MBL7866730.1 glycine C-acetyltransferase [Flavobacterium lindanitolerans]MDQ7960213.1 glycine C-acetyltransferase [Flavobacterium lindanitolerans]